VQCARKISVLGIFFGAMSEFFPSEPLWGISPMEGQAWKKQSNMKVGRVLAGPVILWGAWLILPVSPCSGWVSGHVPPGHLLDEYLLDFESLNLERV